MFAPDTTLSGDASIPEGVVEIRATLRDDSSNQWIKNFVADLMDSQGDLLAIRQIRALPPYHFSAIAEFADADEAIKVAKMFNGAALMVSPASHLTFACYSSNSGISGRRSQSGSDFTARNVS